MSSPERWLELGLIYRLRLNKEEGFAASGQGRYYETVTRNHAKPGLFSKVCYADLNWCLLQRRQWQPTPVLLSGKSHGQRSLVGCSPWGHKGHDGATSLSLFTFMHWRRKWWPTPVFLPGESRDSGAWWAAVCGVAQSRTRLTRLNSSSSSHWQELRVFLVQERETSWPMEIYFKRINFLYQKKPTCVLSLEFFSCLLILSL